MRMLFQTADLVVFLVPALVGMDVFRRLAGELAADFFITCISMLMAAPIRGNEGIARVGVPVAGLFRRDQGVTCVGVLMTGPLRGDNGIARVGVGMLFHPAGNLPFLRKHRSDKHVSNQEDRYAAESQGYLGQRSL